MDMDTALNPYQSPSEPLDALPVSDTQLRVPAGAISFNGSITVEEALEADGILLPWQRVQVYGACLVFGGLAVLCLAMIALQITRGGDGFLPALIGLLIFGSFWAAIVVGRLNIRRRANALYRQRYGIYAETIGYVSAEEVHSRSDAAWSTILWRAFKGYKASSRVIMLYWANSPGFLILTRGKFASEADWQQVRSLIVSRLPPAS